MAAETDTVRILHISDTHGLHRSIQDKYPMPDADILIHTGDFTDQGMPEEWADFDAWLGKQPFQHRIVICGNHEHKSPVDLGETKKLLSNALVLEHELVEILGLRIFGSSWVPGHKSAAPGDTEVPHRFNEIPEGVDILLTHGSPFGIMDYCELGSLPHWGGSKALHKEILRAKPAVHLFGHMHEQRGVWQHRAGEPFIGRIEYDLGGGRLHPTHPAPPPDYPCQIISCNAMKNHPGIDDRCGNPRGSCIAGPARLILANKVSSSTEETQWTFQVAGEACHPADENQVVEA